MLVVGGGRWREYFCAEGRGVCVGVGKNGVRGGKWEVWSEVVGIGGLFVWEIMGLFFRFVYFFLFVVVCGGRAWCVGIGCRGV